MAGSKFQIKRTGVAGRQPNTTNVSNSAYIDVGELAFNFSDQILYSSDGNNAIEIGANVTNQNITGTLTANGSVGTDGQVLTSNGSGIYWGESAGASNWSVKTSDYTAQNGDRILADTSANSFVITLPATPSNGDYVEIADGSNWSLNNLLVNRNGSTIEGLAQNLNLNVGDIIVYFIYGGDGPTWQVVSTLGEKGDTGAGVANSGSTGQYLVKTSNTDFDTQWITLETDLANITGNVVPSVANTYNLGSATNAWEDLYLSGNLNVAGITYPTTDGTVGQVITTNGSGILTFSTVDTTTNLGTSANSTTRTVTSSTGTNAVLPTANSTEAGVMSSADRTKLDGIDSGAQVNEPTNLGTSANSTTRTVTSSTGTDAILLTANSTQAGVMSAADRTKLDGIAAGAQVNVPTDLGTTANSTTRTVTSSTGADAVLSAVTTSIAGVMTASDKTKLDGIASGAQPGTVTSVATGGGLTGGTITTSGTISHSDTSALNGTYGSTADGTKIDTITVDGYGHVTAITTGATGDILGVTAGTGLTGGGTSGTVTLNLNTTAGAIGTLGFFVAVDAIFGGALNLDPGNTVSSSYLYWGSVEENVATGGTYLNFGSGPSGTWRCLGYVRSGGGSEYNASLFIRIS